MLPTSARGLTTTNRKGLFIMATDQPTPIPLTYDSLNFIGARLGEHADNYTVAAADLLKVLANDLKLSARICERTWIGIDPRLPRSGRH